MLIHAGDQPASNLGLYHYTVTTNNAVEGTNTVSIGFHYIAVDTSVNPLVSNTNGIPDYLADANGNGIVDNGEIAWANPPSITGQPASQIANQGSTVTFSVVANGTAPVLYQWQFDGTKIPGATQSTYVVSNVQSSNEGSYRVVLTNVIGGITSSNAILLRASMVVAWGDNTYGQLNVPSGLSNAVAVAGGGCFSLALRNDGTIIGWGDNTYGETNIPVGLSNVVAIAAGLYHGVALLADGSVTNWGEYWDGGSNSCSVTNRTYASAPPTSGVVAVAAGQAQDLALMSNGTCVAWGFTNVYGTGAAYGTMVPTNLNLTNVSAIACGWQFNLALSSNGTLTAWGLSDPAFGSPTNLPGDLITNVAAVAAGGNNGVAMRKNGTVEAWGDSYDGVTNVPYGLSNVVAVATGGAAGLALQADGAVVTWGYPAYTNIPVGLATAKAISAGLEHNLAIRTGSLTPLITQEPADEYGVAGGSVTFAGSGVALALVQYQWQFNGTSIMGATNATLTLMNLQATNEGNYQVVMTDIAGSITSSVATLTLVPPPQIVSISPPANSTNWITMSTFVNVTVNAIGQSVFPLHYLTTFNGSPTRDSLSLELGFAAGYDLSNEGNYSLVISNAAGATTNMTWNFRSALPGEVIPWGADASGECDQVYGMSNATWIAAGDYHSTAVTESGTIVQWGDYFDGALVSPPSHTNYVATAAGLDHDIGLLDNGTVVTWGCSSADANYVPTNLTCSSRGLRLVSQRRPADQRQRGGVGSQRLRCHQCPLGSDQCQRRHRHCGQLRA